MRKYPRKFAGERPTRDGATRSPPAQVSAGPMPSKKSAYGKMYANYDDRVQGINNGKRNAHNRLKSADAVHNQFRHFEDSDACACPAPALLCGIPRGTLPALAVPCRTELLPRVSQAVPARGEHGAAEEEA